MCHIFKQLVVIALNLVLVTCTDISWTWLGGSQGSNAQQSSTNPGGRSGMAYWSIIYPPRFPDKCYDMENLAHDLQVECAKQTQLTIWSFGGEYHVEKQSNKVKNDLWTYSTKDSSWTMVHNGTSDSKESVPVPRQLAASCGVPYSYFIVFGGLDSDEKALGDTWVYYMDDKQWYPLNELRTKIGASNETFGKGPSPRGDMVFWCTKEEMIIFGGFNDNGGLQHDMWIFDLGKLSWRQSKISSELPIDSAFVKHLDYPTARSGATSWVSGQKLFMFGGNILPENRRSKHLMVGYTSDLWDYDLTEGTWTYHKGSRDICTKPGVFGKLGTSSYMNVPSCRRRAAAWVDMNDNLWMFGGDGIDDSQESVSVFKHAKLLSDLWFYNIETGDWIWKGGKKSGEQKGYYGDIGESSSDNLPGSRGEMVVWQNWNGLYLFGGVGHDVNGRDGYLNDIWELDVHLDESVFKNSPYPGPVFGIIFLGCGLVILMIVLYLFSRRRFQNNEQEEKKGKYQQLPVEIDA